MKNKLRRNNWLIAITLLVFAPFSLGQLQRVEFPFGGVYLFEIGIVLFLFSMLPRIVPKLLSRFRSSKITTKFLITWLALLTVLGCLSSDSLVPALYMARYLSYGLFAFLLVTQMPRSQSKKLPSLILSTGLFMTFLGLLQYIFLPDTRFLRALGWDDHYFRAIGTLLDPNYFGMLIILTLSLAFSIRERLTKRLFWFLSTFLLSMLALTYSRSSYLSGAFFIILATFVSKSKKFAFSISTVLLFSSLIFLTAPKPGGEGVDLLRTSSIESRISHETEINSDSTLQQIIFGKGLFVPKIYSNDQNLEMPNHARQPNSILTLVYSGSGIVGLVVAIFVVTKFLRYLYKKDKYITLGLIALLIHANFNNSILEPFLALFWLLLVVVVETKVQIER
ncbi:MAG: hypothetical protein COY80_04550 [Candidatus Pacebacteria bacterium CG_4_10_14_0_8_um_filter_42_14]|nr:MAG: hypothetical protein COY80_04550 [Candidatus Pacebacteria bacterium CG_4_10_14_0_8_um_filter_42_14]